MKRYPCGRRPLQQKQQPDSCASFLVRRVKLKSYVEVGVLLQLPVTVVTGAVVVFENEVNVKQRAATKNNNNRMNIMCYFLFVETTAHRGWRNFDNMIHGCATSTWRRDPISRDRGYAGF